MKLSLHDLLVEINSDKRGFIVTRNGRALYSHIGKSEPSFVDYRSEKNLEEFVLFILELANVCGINSTPVGDGAVVLTIGNLQGSQEECVLLDELMRKIKTSNSGTDIISSIVGFPFARNDRLKKIIISAAQQPLSQSVKPLNAMMAGNVESYNIRILSFFKEQPVMMDDLAPQLGFSKDLLPIHLNLLQSHNLIKKTSSDQYRITDLGLDVLDVLDKDKDHSKIKPEIKIILDALTKTDQSKKKGFIASFTEKLSSLQEESEKIDDDK